MRINSRYRWFDEVPRWRVRRIMARSRAMVLSSVMEGGANVISEAVAGGLPVIASDISGSVGLLGEDYAGYYPVEDTAALTGLLTRVETEPKLLAQLRRQCRAREKLFTPARERRALKKLLDGLVP
jgi:glycosyltransferase involved in cell wall biosynthesis